MISREELNPKGHVLTPAQQANQDILLPAVNLIRAEYGKPMVVTSGVRSWDEHVAIYIKNGSINYNVNGKIEVERGRKFPTQSAHLSGAAADFADPDKKLAKWCLANLRCLEAAGLYMEEPSTTRNWVHLQITTPKSKNRVFLP